MSSAATNMVVEREVDPLLKDLSYKKNSIRRNVVSLAAELKEVRTRLAFQEQSCSREILSRQEAEVKAKRMEEKMNSLQKSIEQRNLQLQASASTSEKYLKELDDLRSRLSATQASAGSSAASAESAQLQCLALLKELDEKNLSLKEHDFRVNNLAKQLELLQKDLQSRECSQKQLKDEVLRIEHNVMHALAESGTKKDGELRKIVHKVSPISSININKLLSTKEEEISKLRDEIRIMSAHWKCKTKELESQLENHTRADQELKKKVLKLEFCLHEARAQTRKLQRMGERRNKSLKELREQLARMNHKKGTDNVENMNFWETSKFKIVVSMSMLALVLFSKR